MDTHLSKIRTLSRKIYTNKCSYNFKRLAGEGVAFVAVLVKVSGSSLEKKKKIS